MPVLAKNAAEHQPPVPLALAINTFMGPHVSIAVLLKPLLQMEKSVMLVSVLVPNALEQQPPVPLVFLADSFMKPHVLLIVLQAQSKIL